MFLSDRIVFLFQHRKKKNMKFYKSDIKCIKINNLFCDGNLNSSVITHISWHVNFSFQLYFVFVLENFSEILYNVLYSIYNAMLLNFYFVLFQFVN